MYKKTFNNHGSGFVMFRPILKDEKMVRKLVTVLFILVVGCAEKKQDLFLDCNQINSNGSLSSEVKRLSIEYNSRGKRVLTFYFERLPVLEGDKATFNETKDKIEIIRPSGIVIIDRFSSDVTFSYTDGNYWWSTKKMHEYKPKKKVLKFKCKKVERQF